MYFGLNHQIKQVDCDFLTEVWFVLLLVKMRNLYLNHVLIKLFHVCTYIANTMLSDTANIKYGH